MMSRIIEWKNDEIISVYLRFLGSKKLSRGKSQNAAFSSTKPQRISSKTFLFMHKYAVARLFANVLDFLG